MPPATATAARTHWASGEDFRQAAQPCCPTMMGSTCSPVSGCQENPPGPETQRTIDPLLAMVVLFIWACVHDDPSAGPVLAGSTGCPPAEGTAGAATVGPGGGAGAATVGGGGATA